MAKPIPETGWHVFGQCIGIIGGVVLIVGLLYLLLLAPYERHKEVLYRLDALSNSLDIHERANYRLHNERQ